MTSNYKLTEFNSLISDQVDLNVPNSILATATQWIGDNMTPDDVFTDDDLRIYVAKSSMPEDVFEEKELSAWAEANGYTKE